MALAGRSFLCGAGQQLPRAAAAPGSGLRQQQSPGQPLQQPAGSCAPLKTSGAIYMALPVRALSWYTGSISSPCSSFTSPSSIMVPL
jgi:hypothetical protein